MENRNCKRHNASTSIGVPTADGSFRIRLAQDEIEWLREHADKENVSRATLIRKQIRKLMEGESMAGYA